MSTPTAHRDQATAVQPFAYTAHNALRASVMGHDAWERAATTDEVDAMVALLDDALRAGSLGMSTNWFDTDRQRASSCRAASPTAPSSTRCST